MTHILLSYFSSHSQNLKLRQTKQRITKLIESWKVFEIKTNNEKIKIISSLHIESHVICFQSGL